MSKNIRSDIKSESLKILRDEVDFVSGCRNLVALCMQLPDTEQVIFNPIRGFVSETDTYPIGEVRKLWDQTALSLLDSEISEYIEQSRPVIIQTCKKICEFYN